MELRSWAIQHLGLTVCLKTMWNILQKADITRKFLSIRAKQRSEFLRVNWAAKLIDYKASQLVFLDETAVSRKTIFRTHGYAPRGAPAAIERALRSRKRYSVLPAFSIDGYITWYLKSGSITMEEYTAFIQKKVLPLCNPWPGPRSVLVMDNASIHVHHELVEAARKVGVQVEYLPPYSPDLNPIEASFHSYKAYLRREGGFSEEFFQNEAEFLDFLEGGLVEVNWNKGNHAQAQFRNCGIYIDTSE
jgi:hypothetical protein